MRRPLPTASEVMTRRVETIDADAPVQEAVRTLLTRGHSGAPVVDAGGAPIGVLSEHDGIRVLTEAIATGWPTGRARDHMTQQVETVRPGDDLLTLATRFAGGRHRRLVVVDGGRLVGLVTRRDLLRALDALEREQGRSRSPSTYEVMAERHRELD